MSEEKATDKPDAHPSEILRRLAGGDEAASSEIFSTYLTRLTALARSRLSARLASRVDADDIVMSAYRSFFVRARRGDFCLEHGQDLWRLLAEITLHKLYRQTAYHSAQRRAVARETFDPSGLSTSAITREPSPEIAAALADEVQAVMQQLSSEVRQVLELRLQGYELAEIAKHVGRSERTVRRWLDDAKQILRKRFPNADAFPASLPRRHPRKRPIPRPLILEPLPQPSLEFNDYVLERTIGLGTSSKVYRAVVRPDNHVVAVKFLKKNLLRHPFVTRRFIDEAQILARLRHPGLIRVQGIGRTPNQGLFLAMDYFAQGDLQQYTAAHDVPLSQILRWLHETAEAVQHAHEHGVVHCDLKPSNLLLADDGRAVVTDFGFARRVADEDCREVAGTPAFLAPEQLEPDWGTVGERTDVYGLGGTLYTLVSRRPPREGSVRQVLNQVAAGRPIPRLADAPDTLADLCERCLAPRPQDRYVSAAEVAAAIKSISRAL